MKEDKGDIYVNNQTNENDQVTLGEANEAMAELVNAPVIIISTSDYMSSI